MRYFNFNNSTKNAISRLSFAFSIIACILFAGTVWGQAKVTVGSDISATGSMVLEVSGVDNASVSATPVERTSPNGKQLYCAYDIDITKDGREWQPEPEQPAMVSMEGTNFTDGQMLDIYHEGANGLEFVATVASENGKITFPAHSFSVYIVAEAEDYNRLKVVLHQADGNEVTIWVKKFDLDTYQGAGNFNRIVYNPGMGMPPDGVVCMGWTADRYFEVEDTSNVMTYADIRDSIASRLTAGVDDGTELHFYAMIFKSYTVTFYAENGSVAKIDELLYPADIDSPQLDYRINADYNPGDPNHNFEGWLVRSHEDGEHIVGHADDSDNYPHGRDITITDNVFFKVNVSIGHWLVFDENGKGAKYNAPQFVRFGQETQRPVPDSEMIRFGYTFGGWYKNTACTGEQFSFGNQLDDNITIYAKWNPKENADYTIIIWKQNITGDGYDFDISIPLSGGVGSTINTVEARNGTGNADSYARINNVNYTGTNVSGHNYTGFHLKEYDQNVVIATEGNSVLNVYYNRTQYTLHFQDQYSYTVTTSNRDAQYGIVNGRYAQIYYKRNKWRIEDSNSGTEYTGTRYTRSYQGWHDISTITALYGQSIVGEFPIPNYKDYNWTPYRSSIFNSDYFLAFLDVLPAENTVFRGSDPGSGYEYPVKYYVEALPTDVNTVTYSGRRFVPYIETEWYSSGGLSSTRNEDFVDLLGFDQFASDPAYGQDNRVSIRAGVGINFYYLRKMYSIVYLDGVYVDGNDNPQSEVNHGELHRVDNIVYDGDVSSYNKDNPNYYTPTPQNAGYVFEGWFLDKVCTHPYTFSNMPEGGITVYAKWRQIQYRVFLHPNAGTDETLDWGSETQQMNFRITYGGKISVPEGLRSDYAMVGWFTDEACTQFFNKDVVLNESTVTSAYDKSTDFTNPMDKWGDGATWNSDFSYEDTITHEILPRDLERFWIAKKFDLYCKWRAILRGAIGINVEYDANGGYDAPVDTLFYQDNVEAAAGHACSHTDPNKEFSHWVLQSWNGSEWVNVPNSRVLPGDKFTVLKSNSIIVYSRWYNPNDVNDFINAPYTTAAPDRIHTLYKAEYRIRLRAEYVDIEKPTYTYIKWFRNYGTDNNVEIINGDSEPLGINVAVEPPVLTRDGYNFKGWYTSEDETGAIINTCDPNFLHYNNGAFTEGSHVAADNYEPIQYLYAIWEPKVEFTFEAVCQGAPIELPLTTTYGVDLSASGWTWTATSGTVDGRSYTPSDGASVTLTFNPASSTCAQAKPFDMELKTPNVANPDDYDFIWRGGTASHLTDWNTESNWFVYNSNYSIATAVPTSESRIYIGPADCITSNWPSQTAEASAKDITIASGASLTVPTGKTLKIYGNLDNIGTLSSATDGTVEFCGTSARREDQTISHDITLGNVVFYNQGGDIVPSGNVTINGAATFKDGVVKHDVTFGNNASVADAGIMTYNSFVEGKVTKNGNASGFTFPTGKDNVLGKIEALSEAYNVSVQYFRNSTGFSLEEYPRWWNINDMCSDNRPQLDHVSNVEYWDVATTLGIEAVLTVSAADGSAHFNSNTLTHEADDIYGAFWNGSCWENIGGGSQHVSVEPSPYGTISVDVKIPQTRTVYDKIVTLGSKDHNTILPIELTSFSATCDGRSSYVKWTTATEKNNDYFSLERSDDAINFVEIARIAGAGNSIEPLSYSYTDYGVYGGDNYYRLVQVDYDGTRTASEIIVTNCVEASEEEPEVIAYPNPFSSDLTVELENFGDRPASIEVYDVLGRLVYVEKADAPQNSYQTILHLDGLSNSTYTVRVSTADFVINRKVVKD